MAESAHALPGTLTAVYRLPAIQGQHDDAAREPERTPDWREPLLWRNAQWFCQLRWLVVAVFTLVGVAGLLGLSLARWGLAVAPEWPLGAAGGLAALNALFRRLAAERSRPARTIPVRVQLWGQIVTDLLMLTAVIHWLGSGVPAAPYMYLFHIVLACIVLSPAESLVVAALAAVFYIGCLVAESQGWVARTSVLNEVAFLDGSFPQGARQALEVGAMLLIWAVIWFLVSRLAGALLRREHELALTNSRLEASGKERARHMLQTTHQLKAPFAAIHAQIQLLLGGYCGVLPMEARRVVEKIGTRCAALSRSIQEMLQLANLRSVGQNAPACREVDLAVLAEAAVARLEPAARQRSIGIRRELEPAAVNAVEDHLTMLLDNLVGNAVAYSREGGDVTVACRPARNKGATLVVRDRGIGIPEQKLPRIFDDYYRTEEAVQHNPMSTGLGLAIVRHVAEEAGLEIQVESTPGAGTCFTVSVPPRPPEGLGAGPAA